MPCCRSSRTLPCSDASSSPARMCARRALRLIQWEMIMPQGRTAADAQSGRLASGPGGLGSLRQALRTPTSAELGEEAVADELQRGPLAQHAAGQAQQRRRRGHKACERAAHEKQALLKRAQHHARWPCAILERAGDVRHRLRVRPSAGERWPPRQTRSLAWDAARREYQHAAQQAEGALALEDRLWAQMWPAYSARSHPRPGAV